MTTMTMQHSAQRPRTRVLLGLIVLLMSLWPLYSMAVKLVIGDHADNRHGGERYPPSAIRACLANLVVAGVSPFQYEDTEGGRVAAVCKLDYNRYGVQINRVIQTSDGRVLYREITSFYGTLSRVTNILTRDGYTSVVPLPDKP